MNNELAGKFYTVRSGPWAGTLCQVLDHPETIDGLFCAGPTWGLRIPLGNLMATETPEPYPAWAYASWQTIAGGAGRNPQAILYGFGDLEFWDDGRLVVWGSFESSTETLSRQAALSLAAELKKWANA